MKGAKLNFFFGNLSQNFLSLIEFVQVSVIGCNRQINWMMSKKAKDLISLRQTPYAAT